MTEMIMRERSDLPPVPNDPAHPLRPYVFCWTGNSHLDARTWYGYSTRDVYHGVKQVKRYPRGRLMYGKGLPGERVVTRQETVYIFADDPEHKEHTHSEMMAILRARLRAKGIDPKYLGDVHNHPLVQAWARGEEIPYTPSDPAFPVGSAVRHNYSDLPLSVQERMRERDDDERTGTVEDGNALFVLVDWGGREHWHVAATLDQVDTEAR